MWFIYEPRVIGSTEYLKGPYYAIFYCLLFNLFDLIELIYNNKGLSSALFFLLVSEYYNPYVKHPVA